MGLFALISEFPTFRNFEGVGEMDKLTELLCRKVTIVDAELPLWVPSALALGGALLPILIVAGDGGGGGLHGGGDVA